jgi:predicted alpha/beta superfamily hydrolase
MKFRFGYLFLLILFFSKTNAQSIARVENIKIQSTALNQEREILIYTPVDYDWRKNEYFNVIYVFDSHNREFFDYTSSIIPFLTDNSKSYIIVGITSPYNEKLDYARNNDLLPILETKSSIDRYGKYSGNADNFLEYISNEVIPYVNSNYRIKNHSIAVGHSLGASFILHSLVEEPNLFKNYIAISPNFAFENNKIGRDLVNFNYSKIEDFTYLYLSNANEGFDYWKEWKPARESVYSFFNDTLNEDNLAIKIAEYPKNNHWNTFPPSLNNALEYYFNNILDKQEKELSKKEYDVTIRVKVPNEKDTIYITGNQSKLGNWNPKKIMMEKVSEYERELSLKLKSPAQFKFTRGEWDSEAEIIGTYGNVTIKPDLKEEFEFEIIDYLDRIQ